MLTPVIAAYFPCVEFPLCFASMGVEIGGDHPRHLAAPRRTTAKRWACPDEHLWG